MFVRRVWPSRRATNPFHDSGRLLRDLEQLLDVASQGVLEEPRTGVFPALNITRDPNSYHVRAELPGVLADELQITTEGAKLSVAGRREIPAEDGDVSYHRRERASGSFSRTVVLPNDVDGERVQARYVDGILTITLPISEQAKARQITVQTN